MAAPSGLLRITYSKFRCLRVLRSRQAHIRAYSNRTLSNGDSESSDEGDSMQYDELYPGHIPTTFFQKTLLTIGSAAMSLYDPSRDDMIATLGETSGYWALKTIKRKMEEDPVGTQILREQPELNTKTVSIDYLGSLPEGTFGKEYWKFLDGHGFSPDARLGVQFVDDLDLMYVMLRYRQTHDLFHTILGMETNMLGEVAVKWVEAFQTGLPMCTLGAIFGPLRLGPVHTKRHIESYLPWAIRNGRNAHFLMAVYWEKHWEEDISVLRNRLNIEPAPVLSKQ